MALTIQMVSDDRARVALEEAVEDGARPPIEDSLAHRPRQSRATHIEPRLGTALDGVLEFDGGGRRSGFSGVCSVLIPRPGLDRNPASANPGLQKPARLVQVGKPIAIALPRRELEAVALGQLQPASQLSFRECQDFP